jgi:hypothetical protein
MTALLANDVDAARNMAIIKQRCANETGSAMMVQKFRNGGDSCASAKRVERFKKILRKRSCRLGLSPQATSSSCVVLFHRFPSFAILSFFLSILV